MVHLLEVLTNRSVVRLRPGATTQLGITVVDQAEMTPLVSDGQEGIMGRLSGKVAIVTGGAMGIGRATATLFAQEGAKVVVADIEEAAADGVAREAREAGGEAVSMRLDVADESDWLRIIAETVKAYGKLNVLVNNAGVSGGSGDAEDMSLGEFEQAMRTNATSIFLGMKHAVAAMKGNGEPCSIINRSSIYGLVGETAYFGYDTSKGAITQMTRSAALAMSAKGYSIRVNSVHPGFIWTPMVEQDAANQGISAEEHYAALAALTPIGFLGEPIDVAYLDLYLASDESRWMTGSSLTIDGGYTAQ
jgi:NAD(P)-dependent dehydrogenase (short-subunit alcohol dehydrogenase family)